MNEYTNGLKRLEAEQKTRNFKRSGFLLISIILLLLVCTIYSKWSYIHNSYTYNEITPAICQKAIASAIEDKHSHKYPISADEIEIIEITQVEQALAVGYLYTGTESFYQDRYRLGCVAIEPEQNGKYLLDKNITVQMMVARPYTYSQIMHSATIFSSHDNYLVFVCNEPDLEEIIITSESASEQYEEIEVVEVPSLHIINMPYNSWSYDFIFGNSN